MAWNAKNAIALAAIAAINGIAIASVGAINGEAKSGGGGGSVAFDNVSPDITGDEEATLTSAAWTLAGSNRAAFGLGYSNFASAQVPNAMRVGGSGGTVMSTIGSVISAFDFRAQAFGVANPASGSNTAYCTFATAPKFSILKQVSYTGVNQTTPAVNAASPTNGNVEVPGGGGATTGTATITVDTTGLIGQKVLVFLCANVGGGDIPTFTPQGTAVQRGFTNYLDFMFVQVVEKEATTSSTTVDVLIANMSTAAAFCQWQMVGFVVNPA